VHQTLALSQRVGHRATACLTHISSRGCCGFAGDGVKLQHGEQLIKEQDNAVWVRGSFKNVVGKLVLTTQRLAFEQRSVIQSSILSQFGGVGALADAALPRNVVVNLPLGQLATFSRPKVVSSRKVIPITTKNGEEFLFSGPKFEQWAPVLMQVGLIEGTQVGSTPPVLPYGQQVSHSQQPAYSVGYGYAPPQRQAPSKAGIPWWGWLLIVGGIVLLACGVLTIALFALGIAVSDTATSSVAATLAFTSG
jgi:hypothetical protein